MEAGSLERTAAQFSSPISLLEAGRVLNFSGNGTLKVSSHAIPGVTIGSLEGDGIVLLGGNNLGVGSNEMSTEFSGIIEDDDGGGASGGSLSKTGSGTLTLSSVNTYTGGTTVEGGALLVKTSRGSATGTGPVQVNAGIFGGRSNILGPVIIGSGSGSGAYLAPGIKGPGDLVIKESLSFKADGIYNCELSIIQSKADQVTAKGVTIESGAQFDLQAKGNQTLPIGTVFMVVNNKSRQLINGTFVNLPDGSIVSVNGNNLRVSYTGGDGNDLTLTVVQ